MRVTSIDNAGLRFPPSVGRWKTSLLKQTPQQQLSNQLRAANKLDKLDFYKCCAFLHQKAYQVCMVKENKKPDANPHNCQNEMNIVNYYNGMAAAAQQPQFDTTQSSQAMRSC